MLWAVGVSALGPAGAFLAAIIGLDAAVTAAGSWRWLAGHAPDPARRMPALLIAAVTSWTAAATVGGLGARGVLDMVSTVGLLLAAARGLLALMRRAAGEMNAEFTHGQYAQRWRADKVRELARW